MKINVPFYLNKVKYLLFWGIFPYFLIFLYNYWYFLLFNSFWHICVRNGWKCEKNFLGNFSIQKIPILGGFSSFLWIFFPLFCSYLLIFIFSIFPYFKAILLHRTIFCQSYMHFMFFRWLILYIWWKQCTCEESYF